MRRRGFSMLELVIGMTISLAIAGVAMSLLLVSQASQKETQLKNAVTRDVMYIVDMIGGDLGFAGVGVPYGENGERAGDRLRPVVRVAEARNFTFIGDLPLPNAELNGLVHIANMPGGDTDLVAVASEVSTCAPPSGSPAGYDCDSTQNTLINNGGATGTDECAASRMGARTCPWGMGKWQPNGLDRMAVIVGAPTGEFAQREVLFDGAGVPQHGAVGRTEGIRLSAALPAALFGTPRIGQATIASVDRVFYTLVNASNGPCAVGEECALMRRQCWGAVGDNDSPGFPAAGGPAIDINASPAGCENPGNGTRWEPVATSIAEFTFRYFARDGAVIPTPVPAARLEDIAAVEVDLLIRRKLPGNGAELEHRMTRRWFLEAGDAFGDHGRRVP